MPCYPLKKMIELKKAKKIGYAQYIDGVFFSSQYHPQQEAQRVLDFFLKNFYKEKSENKTYICLLGLFPIDIIALSIAMESIQDEKLENIFLLEGNDIASKHYQKILKELFAKKMSHFSEPAAKFYEKYQWTEDELIKKICKRIENEKNWEIFLQKISDKKIENMIIIKSAYAQKSKVENFFSLWQMEKAKRKSEIKTAHGWERMWNSNKKSNMLWWIKLQKNKTKNKDALLGWINNFSQNKITTEKMAIFVASGPSLDKNMEQLRFWSKKCNVYSVVGMAEALIENGVQVKAVIASDPGYYQKIHFDSLIKITEKYQKKVLLIAPTSCYAASVRQYAMSQTKIHGEKSIFFYLDTKAEVENLIENFAKQFNDNASLKRFIDYVSSIYCTHDGNVTLCAMRILHLLGYKKVTTLGCDFTTNGFAYHARGYSQEEYFFSRLHRFMPFETILQKSYFFLHRSNQNKNDFTDQKWLLYDKHFDKLSKELSEKDCQIKNFEQFLKTKNKIKKNHNNLNSSEEKEKNDFFSKYIITTLNNNFYKSIKK